VDPGDEPTVPLNRPNHSLDDVLPVGALPVGPLPVGPLPGDPLPVDPLPVGSPPGMPINPRIRERLVAVRRAQGRKRLKVVVGIAGVVVLAALAVGLTRSPILAVRHVKVSGDAHTPRAAVLAVTALDRHPQMIDLSSGRLRHELMALPWVASASIQRQWPATVEIRLLERVPVAQVAGPRGQPAIVDRDGRVLASGSAATAAALPAVNGAGKAGPPGTFLGPGNAPRDALALLVATQTILPPGSPYRLQAVEIRPDGRLQAKLTPRVTVLFGSTDQLGAKLLALQTLLEQVPLRGPVTLDVRVPTSPVLTHQ
jgi:cell division protein FtsQ